MKCNIWKDVPAKPLPAVLSTIVDNRGKTVPTAEKGHKLIATNCIRNENLYPTYEKVRFLSDETYNSWFRAHPQANDIIFVCKGTPGRVCMVPNPVDFCIAQDMVALRADDSIVYNKYLLAVLRSREIQMQITNTSVGDVIPHFKKSHFDQVKIPLPDMWIQKRIGDIYFSFLHKIELNNQMNKNLEAQAQAIFKSWFVNFEPWGGVMPEDWREGTISDLGEVVGGSTPSKAKEEYYTTEGLSWITPKDLSINKNKFIFHGEIDITELGLKNSSARMMPRGTVLFSSRAPIGYTAIAGKEICTNQGFKSIVPNCEIGTAYVYYFILENLSVVESMASGSTFKEISTATMRIVPTIIPSEETLAKFNTLCDVIFEKQEYLENQSQTLAALRDTLLPKLMSGEISLPKEA